MRRNDSLRCLPGKKRTRTFGQSLPTTTIRLILGSRLGRVKIAVAAAPDTTALATGRPLRGFEARQTIEALILIAIDVGEATPELSEFELTAVDDRVGEKPAVAIGFAGNRVGTKNDVDTFGRKAFHRRNSRLGPALGRIARTDVLGRVDTNKADIGEGARRQANPQGVAVDGVVDRRVDRRRELMRTSRSRLDAH